MASDLVRPTAAVAYVNEGRWVCDCPAPDCTSAAKLTPGQFMFSCLDCHLLAEITWPDPREAHEIWQVLSARPDVTKRNWFPRDHWLALAAGCPHGQTPAELLAETNEELARELAEAGRVKIAAEREQVFAAQAAEVRAARKELRERWADEGHGIGGPLFHPGSDERGFPPEHTITRGIGQVAPPCHCGEPGCKPKGGK